MTYHEMALALAQFCEASCNLGSWCFSIGSKQLFHSEGLSEPEFAMFFDISGCLDYAVDHAKEFDDPVLLEDALGMLWIADYASEEGRKTLLFVLGPFFNAAASMQNIEQRLWELNLPLELRMPLMEKVKLVPVLPISTAQQYALMLHRALTGKNTDISHLYIQQKYNVQILSDEGILDLPIHPERLREHEQRILLGIRNGSLTEREFNECIDATAEQDDYHTGSPLRQAKNTTIIFTALCSRAAVDGGLSPTIAKELEIAYIREAEQITRILELQQLVRRMVMGFVEKVALCRSSASVSHAIQEVCYYVDNHLTEPLELEALAKSVGYTGYYLTKKFKKETGVYLTDYIKQKRLELARLSLENSDKTVEEISAELNFGTRNYFTKVFKAAYGVSPTQYRQRCRGPQKEGDTSQ